MQFEEHIHKSTRVPSQAWVALHWLYNNMSLVWDFNQIAHPFTKKRPEDRKGQTNGADHNMMWSLETALKESIEEGRRNHLSLLSQWLGVLGVRTRHVKR